MGTAGRTLATNGPRTSTMALARYDQPVGGSGAVNGSTSPVLWVALAKRKETYRGRSMGVAATRTNAGLVTLHG
jgi:hypothetical protein